MAKTTSKITAVLTLAFIAAFSGMTLFSEKKDSSFDENRRLAEVPAFTAEKLYSGDYSKELGSCLTDHFAGRSKWISAKTAFQTQLSESIVNGVYVGKDRLLDVESSDRAPVSAYAEIFRYYKSKYDGTVYFAAIPTSAGVYGDVLPVHIANHSDSQQISAFYDALGSDIRKIDAYNILKMLKDNYVFYRNDTKWTSYGAYCVYKTVVKKLGFIPTPYDKYEVEHVADSFRGNLYNRTLSEAPDADVIDIYDYPDGVKVESCICTRNDGSTYKGKIYDRSRLDSEDMYSMYLGEAVPFMRITTNVQNDRKLLVVKDSYADCFIPFLIQHYSEIAVASPSDMEGCLSDYVDINDYGQTLFLFGIEDLDDSESLEKIIERK